jgi:hypothetical protein
MFDAQNVFEGHVIRGRGPFEGLFSFNKGTDNGDVGELSQQLATSRWHRTTLVQGRIGVGGLLNTDSHHADDTAP